MGYLGYKPADKPLTAADITDSIITSAKIVDGTIVNGDIANSTIALAKLSATGTADATTFLRGDNSFATPAAGAMVFLASATASNVANLNLNGYFTSDYDVYKIFIYNAYSSASANDLRFRVATTGSYTIQSGSDYYGSGVYSRRDSSTATLENYGNWGSTFMVATLGVGSGSSNVSNAEITIFNPLSTSVKKKFNIHSNGIDDSLTVVRSGNGSEIWNSTTAITGLNFFNASGNTYGTYKLYGVKNS
jgi:hypothetical protein